jgi:DNA-binding MarR family transcriptional regulator
VDRQPIGYWLKEIDRLIEENFARLLVAERLTRRHWQVLNTLAERPRTIDELDAELSPFRSVDVPSVEPVVGDLRGRGWIDETLALTEKGRLRHREISELVMANRRRLTDGISPREYQSVLDVLERMAGNLTTA